MSLDPEKVIFASSLNAYKNTGVYDTSVTVSGTLTAGQTRSWTSVVTLPENQDFSYAVAKYVEFTKGGAAVYQQIPVFDASITTTPTGGLTASIYYTISGSTITFTVFMNNPYGGTETITSTTVDIRYVTYTTAN